MITRNDLSSALNIIEDILFMRMTTLTVSSPNLNTFIGKLNEVFNNLELWMQQNQMQLNKSRTKIFIHRSNNFIYIFYFSISLCFSYSEWLFQVRFPLANCVGRSTITI